MAIDRCAKHDHNICVRQVSWTAVIVGAFVGMGLSFLLNLFSIATGLSFVTNNKEGLVTLAVGGFIGLLIGAVATMFTAGFVAGKLGQKYNPKRNLGVVYGFTTWSVMLVLTALLASHMGKYVTVYSNFVSNPTTTSFHMERGAWKHGKGANVVVTTADKNADKNTDKNVMVDQDTQDAANKLGIASFLVFAIFFIGALSCCIGGHYGMTCVCHDDD